MTVRFLSCCDSENRRVLYFSRRHKYTASQMSNRGGNLHIELPVQHKRIAEASWKSVAWLEAPLGARKPFILNLQAQFAAALWRIAWAESEFVHLLKPAAAPRELVASSKWSTACSSSSAKSELVWAFDHLKRHPHKTWCKGNFPRECARFQSNTIRFSITIRLSHVLSSVWFRTK